MASALCKYDLRKGDLFVLSWEWVRRMSRGSISSERLMCGGGAHSILLFPLVARCLETIDVCIWCMLVFVSVVVTVWGSVGIHHISYTNILQHSKAKKHSLTTAATQQCFRLGVLRYVVCLCKECDGCCVFCLYCDA